MLTAAERNEMLQTISDLSKEAYGYRVRLDYATMSDAELRDTWDGFIRAADAAFEQEKVQAARAKTIWEEDIQQLIKVGAGDRATAIRWDMEAMDAKNGDQLDAGYYCYLRGIGYSLEHEVRQLIAA